MPNPENLIPNSERSPSELRANASKGGKASGESRRRKKAAREAAKLFLSLNAPFDISQNLISLGIDQSDANMQMAIIAGLAQQAVAGNHNAAKLIFELSGDMEKQQEEETAPSGLIDALNDSAPDVFEAGDDSGIVGGGE